MANSMVLGMEIVVTMDKSGRLVLPGPIRNALQISEAAAFKAEVVGNKVELTLVPPVSQSRLKQNRGFLIISTGRKPFDGGEAINAMREERE